MIKYQNNYSSSFLFLDNLSNLFEMDLELRHLFSSNVFHMEFKFEEWPSIHTNSETVLKPYNGSIFGLKDKYDDIFPEK